MDILGIGHALVDIFFFSDEETALPLGLHPNSTVHVPPERLDEILLGVTRPMYISGGSASNALKAAAFLGADCAFIGCGGTEDREEDQLAALFKQDLASCGIPAYMEERTAPTGRCLILHMPGNMKTVACAPGAAPALRPEQITAELLSQAKIVHIDGHILRNKPVTDRIVNLCRGFSIPLSIDIAAPSIARAHAADIMEILTHVKCIVFANEDESATLAKALYELMPGREALEDVATLEETVFSALAGEHEEYPYIVKKQGEKGASSWASGRRYSIKGRRVENALDETGAGDIFAGAWLAGLLAGKEPEECLELADKSARSSISVPGSRIDREHFEPL